MFRQDDFDCGCRTRIFTSREFGKFFGKFSAKCPEGTHIQTAQKSGLTADGRGCTQMVGGGEAATLQMKCKESCPSALCLQATPLGICVHLRPSAVNICSGIQLF